MTETIVFGGGCFWCTEAIFKMLKGTISVEPGYSERVEVVKIEYNPEIISFEDLLTVFSATHDPTTLNRQGNDIGEQYRSVIFYTTKEQKEKSEISISELGEGIVTKVEPFKKFYLAENYHNDYYKNHKDQPYCRMVINPKLKKVQKEFANFLKQNYE
jgi:peptide-methionine (S)-S-oxide reductase